MNDKELIEQVKKIASEYPENSINKAILLQIADRFIGQQIQLEERECLHCGKNVAGYCEDCYQDLIGKNAKLQYANKNINNLKVHIEGMRSGKQLLKKYIEDSILKDEIRKKLAEAELKLKNYKAARGNLKPIQSHIQIIKLTTEIEIYKELLEE